MTRDALHPLLGIVDITGKPLVLALVFHFNATTVAGGAVGLHGGRLEKDMPLHKPTLYRIRPGDMALAATAVTREAVCIHCLEDFLSRSFVGACPHADDALVWIEADVEAGLVLGDDFLMALATCLEWIGGGGIRDETLVRNLHGRSLGIAPMAFLATDRPVRIFFKKRVINEYLLIWLQRSQCPSSPLPFRFSRFLRGGLGRNLPRDLHQFFD
jgi:hypothetical protein